MILGFGVDCACVDAKCCAPYRLVTVEFAGGHIPIVFLERIRDEFTKTYGSGKAATAAANSLNMGFGPKLKEKMQWCGDHPEEISKLANTTVKGVMMENIEKVRKSRGLWKWTVEKWPIVLRKFVILLGLDRGVKIELLDDKTENLRSQFACHYARKGKLIELALLLIVAREKILVPINLYVEVGGGSSRRTTILHWLQFQILILTHEEKVMGDCKNGKLTKIRRKKMVMRSASLLLEVFERAGHAVEEIIQYLSRSPCVRNMLFSGLRKQDLNSRMGTLILALWTGLTETNSSPGLPLPQQKIPSLPLWDVSPWSSAQTFPFHQTLGLTSTDKSHYTNHMKQTEPIVQNVPQWLSKVRLARFARFLRRGMKTA
ncbi:hypothetical protein RHMOL_Rhmol06G0278100 [Rhododendron molle]|uniref:Uncharacterized protein n=1 Tax=Rhododendron molle TaxID=49168 RepID=A0ACC0NHT1_RHOML|nr:hypothetical protein RHMOL_Rhmol06G0278100 [Rhododendron molle]